MREGICRRLSTRTSWLAGLQYVDYWMLDCRPVGGTHVM
jgi:hypothetical protein